MAKTTIGGSTYGSGIISEDEKNILLKADKDGNTAYKNAMLDDALLLKQMRSNGYFQPSDMKYRRSFYPVKRMDPYNRVQGTKEYVFFTKPRIPIVANNDLTDQFKAIPYYRNLWSSGYAYQEILKDLSAYGDICPFVQMLTNRITSNIDIPGINVDVLETAQNFWGSKIVYPKTSMSSDEGIEFTCEFEETKHLEIYHFFKAWDLYRQMKWWGIISPPDYCINHKILNDHIAVYKFIVAEDGERLLYWCKWTGVFPSTIGRDTFSEIPVEGPLKLTVTFKVSGWFEDMEPNILSDFRQIVSTGLNRNYNRWKIWDIDVGGIEQENMYLPWVEAAGKLNSENFTDVYFEWLEF